MAHVIRLESTSITRRLWNEGIISFWLMGKLSKNLQNTIRFDIIGFYIGRLTVLVKLGGHFTAAADRLEHFGLINLYNPFSCGTFEAKSFI